MNLISKDTVIPISFALLLLGGLLYGERRLNALQTNDEKMMIILQSQQKQVEKLESQSMPIGELRLVLNEIKKEISEIKEKVK